MMVSHQSVFFDNLSCFVGQIWRTSHISLLSSPRVFNTRCPPALLFIGQSSSLNARSLLLTAPQIINVLLKLDGWFIIHVSKNDKLCHICSYNATENEAHFVLECPQYNLTGYMFPSLFKNVILENLESFFQLDHQIDISLYLMKAMLLHATIPFETISMYFQSHWPFGFPWILNEFSKKKSHSQNHTSLDIHRIVAAIYVIFLLVID